MTHIALAIMIAAYTAPPVEDLESCALLALARIAAAEDARLGAGHWRLARIISAEARTCERVYELAAISRQESSWTSSAVSSAGACGITQVRSCDAPGTVEIACCDGYERRGYHCRPSCAWLQETNNAIHWTSRWLDDFGWNPQRYVGSSNPAVWGPYDNRANMLLALAKGGKS